MGFYFREKRFQSQFNNWLQTSAMLLWITDLPHAPVRQLLVTIPRSRDQRPRYQLVGTFLVCVGLHPGPTTLKLSVPASKQAGVHVIDHLARVSHWSCILSKLEGRAGVIFTFESVRVTKRVTERPEQGLQFLYSKLWRGSACPRSRLPVSRLFRPLREILISQ